MTVSILVPIYGVEQYIERCARSMFEQTFANLDYVFVNDCTPDCSVEILRQVMEDYPERKDAVRIINHERNRGLAAARNTAYDNATGEFVLIVDSDDWLELNAIELLVKKQLETNADIVSGGRIAHTLYGDSIIPLNRCETREEMVCHMMGYSGGQYVWGRLIRRKIIVDNAISCIEGCDCAEDRFVMTKVSYYAQSYGFEESLIYHYERRNAGSIMSKMNSNMLCLLRTGCQEVSNYVALQSFFSDKEKPYRDHCKNCTDSIVKYHLIPAMEGASYTASRRDFPKIVEMVDNYPYVHPFLNWPNKGSKGHNCFLIKSIWGGRWFCRKTKRFVGKRVAKLLG